MPSGIYDGFKCDSDHDEFFPTEHQNATVKFFTEDSPYKGLLLYHKLGSGKTCTSIMIADKLLREKKIRKVFIFTPGSLRKGWITEYCDKCGYKNRYLRDKYTFVTYNYNVGNKLPDIDDSLIIIDEVHNLINGVKNNSKNPVSIYNKLANSNCRILALSGTPIFNYIYEWSFLGDLLKPGAFPFIRGRDKNGNLVSTSKDDVYSFLSLFNINEEGIVVPKNPTRFKRDLEGIISFYPGAGDKFYPRVETMPIIKMVMPPPQEINYWEQYIQEKRLSKPPSKKLFNTNRDLYELLKKLYVMAKKNILTRSASNFYYPVSDDIEEIAELKKIISASTKEEKEIFKKAWKKKKAENTKKKNLELKKWVIDKVLTDGNLYKTYSSKFTAFFVNIVMHNLQKHVAFTFFKEKGGVNLLHDMFKHCGISSAIFSGDLDDSQRVSLLRRFNDKTNRYGDKITVLLVTEAGAEGITILEARHIHILESSPRESKVQQAIGRVVRYKSHTDLRKEEQKVQVWRYWSVASDLKTTVTVPVLNPDGTKEDVVKVISDKRTIDELLYDEGQKNMKRVESFLSLLKEASVSVS